MTAQPNVLFITDNGHGLGHLTRMMAVARRARERFHPVFLTMSQAFPVVRELGWPVEYLPSYRKLGLSKAEWGPMFASRLVGLLAHIRPRVVVIDHIFPSPVLSSIRANSQGIDFIWSRRGMWREGRNVEAIESSDYFDVVVEPRDVAGPIDVGLTSEHDRGVTFVDPVIFVDPDEQMERDQARQALGIPLDGKAVLIHLSDSDEAKLSGLIGKVRDVVESVVGGGIVHFFSPVHALHTGAVSRIDRVIMRPLYPVATYLKAFDGIVSTAGYNSFHEAVVSGLPAVFVARDTPALDDQVRRAGFAEWVGRGFFAPSVDDPRFRDAVQRMLSPDEPEIATRVASELGDFEGGVQFADVIAARCESRARQPHVVGQRSGVDGPTKEVLEQVNSGRMLLGNSGRKAERVAVVALGFDPSTLARLAAQVATLQEAVASFKPVFLVDDVDKSSLDEFGFQFESIMTELEFANIGPGRYEHYVQSSVEGLGARYRASRVVKLAPDGRIDPRFLLGEEV